MIYQISHVMYDGDVFITLYDGLLTFLLVLLLIEVIIKGFNIIIEWILLMQYLKQI